MISIFQTQGKGQDLARYGVVSNGRPELVVEYRGFVELLSKYVLCAQQCLGEDRCSLLAQVGYGGGELVTVRPQVNTRARSEQ